MDWPSSSSTSTNTTGASGGGNQAPPVVSVHVIHKTAEDTIARADQFGCAIVVMIIIISRPLPEWALTNIAIDKTGWVYLTQKIACQIANNQYCRLCLCLDMSAFDLALTSCCSSGSSSSSSSFIAPSPIRDIQWGFELSRLIDKCDRINNVQFGQRIKEERRREVNKMDNHNSNNDNDTIIIINSAAIRSVLRNWIG